MQVEFVGDASAYRDQGRLLFNDGKRWNLSRGTMGGHQRQELKERIMEMKKN
jgi:hypothetical protein